MITIWVGSCSKEKRRINVSYCAYHQKESARENGIWSYVEDRHGNQKPNVERYGTMIGWRGQW